MKREISPQQRLKKGVELFSDMMLMKFKPKNTEGIRLAKQPAIRTRHPSQDRTAQPAPKPRTPSQITYLELASKDAVVIGNPNQIDMINIDGLSHNFVDTFYYWSLNLSRPIDSVKLSLKKELMLVLTGRTMLLYSYNTLKKEKSEPRLITSVELTSDVRFMQFPASDLIAIFYQDRFEVYSLNDANKLSKRLQKPYSVGAGMKLFAVPQAIDHAVNIFFEEEQAGKKTFGLWCVQVRLLAESTKVSPPYKIYDIMCGLRRVLILENYSKDIIFLNLGQEILVARKGYIVDSVNINLQGQSSYLRFLPRQQILVHIQRSSMDLYSFTIDTSAVPHRIRLGPLDSIQIVNRRTSNRLISLLPVLDHNYALFYEEDGVRPTTRGEILYSFVLSYTVDLYSKIQQILGGRNPSELPEDELQTKCDVLRKVGLSDQEIYLEIWRRSGRVSLRDYQLLLATRDYKTIKNEVEEKLKKQSMGFKEVLKIEESCLQILRPKVESEQCTEELLKDYLICSLFLRKLSLWRELHQLGERRGHGEGQRSLYINIQDYFQLKNMELKEFVIQRIGMFLFGGKDSLHEIRIILNHFRFVYRYIYRELLEKIIITAKNELKRLLIAIPELLPTGGSHDRQQAFLYSGVWQAITEDEWESGLHLQRIENVSNREVVAQFVEGLWFKRNWLTMHDLIPKTRADIEHCNHKNNSVQIFYFFIGKLFDSIKDGSVLREVLSHMESTYPQLPDHLRDKILLYSTLYHYYSANHQVAHCPAFSFAEFLELRDYNLFKYFFDLEKMKKNSLLREIKPIYEQVLGDNGVKVFNQSLFNYFRSETSQISNLKYLLNRINNEKKEFHMLHEPMYEVLIKAMQFKLRIGSASDIPVEQVLIYVQNIPISPHNTAMLAELETIRRVSDQSDIFRKMRLNMTIRQIIDNYETVIERLVDYQMKKNGILSSESLPVVLQRTYRLLAQVQSIKEKIYGTDFNELAFFIFLTKMLEQQNKISIAHDILNDQYLNNYYFIDQKIVESLVLYMYRWRFSQQAAFPLNKNYILNLCQLLPFDNHMREYIELELQFALILSTTAQPVLYPIVTQAPSPRIVDLEDILRGVDDAHIVKIDIERVVEVMRRMEQLSHGLSELSRLSKESHYSQKIEENAVFKVFINSFISRNLIKQVVPLVKRSIQSTQKPEAITTLILVYDLLPELNEECRCTLVKIASLLYTFPLRLLGIVQNLLTKRSTGLESIDYLHKEYEGLREQGINYNEDNPIFNVYFIHLDEREKSNKKKLVQNTLIKLKRTKPEFEHQFIFDLLFIILCHEPINISIFLRQLRSIKWRNIRSFISYLIQEEIFDQLLTLQACKRAFFLLLRSYKQKCDVYRLANQYSERSLIEQFKIKTYDDLNQFQKILDKNVVVFQKKKNKVAGFDRSFRLKKHSIEKEVSIKESIKNPDTVKDKQANQYAFSDSDDDYQHDDEEGIEYKESKKKKSKINFDPKSERKNFIRKDRRANIEVRKASPVTNRKKNDESDHQDAKETIKIKKSASLNVIVSNSLKTQEILTPVKTALPDRQQSSESQSVKEPSSGRKLQHKRTFEEQIKKKQSKEFKKNDDFSKGVSEIDSDEDEPLYLSNKISEKSDQCKPSSQEEFQENASITLKKIYRTYDDKQETQPYNIKVLHTEKTKNVKGFNELIKQVVKRIYNRPERNFQTAFKLIIQIGKSYPEIGINLQYAQIFEKISKFETKYGLELPIQKILPFDGLYLKSKTPQQLFSFIKDSIMEICDDQNIFKISKLISIGFKKNTIEQEIIMLYLNKLIAELNNTIDYAELGQGLDKIKGLINKMQVRTLVDKTESIVDQCTHFDLRRKLVQIFIDTIRMKGNGKDAKELANKLK